MPTSKTVKIKDFTSKLRKLRQKRGWSQLEAASRMGLTDPEIYAQYERGYRNVGLKMLLRIADLYEVSLDWLCGRTDKPGKGMVTLKSEVKVVKLRYPNKPYKPKPKPKPVPEPDPPPVKSDVEEVKPDVKWSPFGPWERGSED